VGDQVAAARRLEESSFGPESVLVDLDRRFLQDVLDGVPESNCFCPIGSIDTSFVFDPALFTAEIIAKVRSVTQGIIFVDDPVFGAKEVECVEETDFESTVDFRFSAFESVANGVNMDVISLGNVLAEIYNGLVDEFCDNYFRRDISLTYLAGTLRPVGGLAGAGTREGCFNYAASFGVKGRCRGCLALGADIPLYGTSDGSGTSVGRKLFENLAQDAFEDAIFQRIPRGSKSGVRFLQDEQPTCLCDPSNPRTAPTLSAVQGGLMTVIGSELPWSVAPSSKFVSSLHFV
jgi:hypothetical protein